MRSSRSTPSAVVLSAYRAANRGRYAFANRFLSPTYLDMRHSSATNLRESNRQIRRLLPTVANRGTRARLLSLYDSTHPFEDPHFLWKGSTQGGTVKQFDVLGETVRSRRAMVTLALRLADGRVRIERIRLAQTQGRWEIVAIGVLENKRMKLSKRGGVRGGSPTRG